ncbi:hypothetical protein KAU11_00735 [Candidatus Babeliales bacterium]|nr:hypothetical protein [Candidatus Babeliales bacterium]
MLTPQKNISKKPTHKREKNRSYNEVITLLNVLPKIKYEAAAEQRVKQLDDLLGNPSKKMEFVLVGGTNGKSITVHLAAKLLLEENVKTGALLSDHILSYNERISVNNQNINNRHFAEISGRVLDTAHANKICATSYELMLVSSLLYFASQNVDLAVLEVGLGGRLDATTALSPQIVAITRATADDTNLCGNNLDETAFEMMGVAKPGSWVISAEQSKLRLQKMKAEAKKRNFKWAMPIRKLAPLPYIYEQLYGRSASLAERIAQIYVEDIKGNFSPFLRGNLLATQKGQRGRPTLEAKRAAELNPVKTLKNFWTTQFELLRGRFELLEKEKPTILLDNADNYDAFSNVFLGLRLLHYRRPISNIAVILGLKENANVSEILKLSRYLLKKISGKLFFVPLPNDIPCYNPTELAQSARAINIRAHAFGSLKEAFNAAKNSVDERNGVVAVTGSHDLVSDYWKTVREIKKL